MNARYAADGVDEVLYSVLVFTLRTSVYGLKRSLNLTLTRADDWLEVIELPTVQNNTIDTRVATAV